MDLPDADNRLKILKIFLAQENVEPGFDVRSLANATEGYSGSDLKVIFPLATNSTLLHFFRLYFYLFLCRIFALLQHIDLFKNFLMKKRKYVFLRPYNSSCLRFCSIIPSP